MASRVDVYNEAMQGGIELANRLAEQNGQADLWDIADGLLAGAIHYWLYSRQPCGDPRCEDCEALNTAEKRLAELARLAENLAHESDYYHSPNDINVGRA